MPLPYTYAAAEMRTPRLNKNVLRCTISAASQPSQILAAPGTGVVFRVKVRKGNRQRIAGGHRGKRIAYGVSCPRPPRSIDSKSHPPATKREGVCTNWTANSILSSHVQAATPGDGGFRNFGCDYPLRLCDSAARPFVLDSRPQFNSSGPISSSSPRDRRKQRLRAELPHCIFNRLAMHY
jgi:hypothetical protein